MSKATLVIMAAGIGSRFGGGIKQLEPVGQTERSLWIIQSQMQGKQGLTKLYL